MFKTANEEVQLLNISQAAKLTHLGRDRIAAAMNKWMASKGAFGLAFVLPGEGRRRLVRISSLKRWLDGLERRVCYGG